jgi:hypothetical protein
MSTDSWKRGMRWNRPVNRDRDLRKRDLRWNHSLQRYVRRSRTRDWSRDTTPHMKWNTTPHWHRENRRGYPTPYGHWRDRSGALWHQSIRRKTAPHCVISNRSRRRITRGRGDIIGRGRILMRKRTQRGSRRSKCRCQRCMGMGMGHMRRRT